MKIRTFVALEIPEEAIEKIINIRKDKIGDGEILNGSQRKTSFDIKIPWRYGKRCFNAYIEYIKRIVSDIEQFELCSVNSGYSEKEVSKDSMVGLNENDKLKQFADTLDSIFENYGYIKEEREFKAHITLLRFHGYENMEKILSLSEVKIPEIKFIANKVVFFESQLKQNGSVYKSLMDFNLKN